MKTTNEMYKDFMKMKKENLAELLTRIIYMLPVNQTNTEKYNSYLQGWVDSRNSIIETLELRKYINQPLKN